MNNYHTHTFRCTHATGTEEQMVQRAIEEGYSELGFSEHVPLPYFRFHLIKALPFAIRGFWTSLSWMKAFLFDGPGMRMPYKEKKIHLKEINRVKEKYQDQIQIYKGFECEYLKEYLSYYRKLLETKEVDYLILGHHFRKYAVSKRYYARKNALKFSEVESYVSEAIAAMQTGLFTCFAHPDIFMNGYPYWNAEIESLVRKMCEVAQANDVLLEINGGGLRGSKTIINNVECYTYPNIFFWQVASEVGCKCIIGMDAHHPNHLAKESFQKIQEFAKELNLEVVDQIL